MGGDWEKLLSLERQIQRCFVSYCPGDQVEVEKIMSLEPKRDWDFTSMADYCLAKRKLKTQGFQVRELEVELAKLRPLVDEKAKLEKEKDKLVSKLRKDKEDNQ